jgi:pyruvate dehydrogenase E1 component alpha subunit
MTFRFFGHVFGDDDSYMSKEEKAEAISRDPVPAFRAKLIADGVATAEQLASMEAKIADDIEEAIKFALSSEVPPPGELLRDVYAERGGA